MRGSYSAGPRDCGELEETILDLFAGSLGCEQHALRAGVRRKIEVGATNEMLSIEENAERIGREHTRTATSNINCARPLLQRVVGIASVDLQRQGSTLKFGPLGPLGYNSPNIAQRHALHVERTAEKAFMLSDRV